MKLDKPGDFVGRAALARGRRSTRRARVLTGLAGESRRVPRQGYTVLWDGQPCGTVTSGAPSPTLGQPIAMAYLDATLPRQAPRQRKTAQPGGWPWTSAAAPSPPPWYRSRSTAGRPDRRPH